MATIVLNGTGEKTLWFLALNKLVFLLSFPLCPSVGKLDQTVLPGFSKALGQGGAFQTAQAGLQGSV